MLFRVPASIQRLSPRDRGNTELKHRRRSDIQGLRAIAVLLVISDHLFDFPLGGFVGVDVFFVISGFLITGLLIREQGRSGKISFANFYRRRARRILPLAVLVIAVTIAGAWAIFNNARALRVAEEGFWSLIFGANWHFAAIGTDYMQADGIVSPLQHFWSLAVEEQFYVVWPWVIILVLGYMAGRARWTSRKAQAVLIVCMSLFAVASFAYGIWETSTSPTVSYFSTFSRAWELTVGALLAASAPALKKIPDFIRPVIAYVGLGGIIVGAALITPELPFPAPWAAVPVLATALVIMSGTGTSMPALKVLANPVSRYIGDISYSLYLWHFPAIILVGTLLPLNRPVDYLLVLGIILGLSGMSYYFLEQPMIDSQWLEPKATRKISKRTEPGRLTYGALVALFLVTAITVTVATIGQPTATGYVSAPAPAATAASTDSGLHAGPESVKLASQIRAALASQTWPVLVPAVEELGPKAKANEWVNDNCLMGDYGTVDNLERYTSPCIYGDPNAPKTAVILGDSTAISYAPTVRAALEPKGYKVIIYTLQQCPAVNVQVLNGDKLQHAECDEFRNWAFAKIRDLRPDAVFLASLHSAALASGATGGSFEAEWRAGAKDTYEQIAGEGTQIVVLGSPPIGKELSTCLTRNSVPADCVSDTHPQYLGVSEANREAAKSAGIKANVEVLETTSWFCADTKCPAFVGSTPVYADGYHLTSAYATFLVPVLTESLALKQR